MIFLSHIDGVNNSAMSLEIGDILQAIGILPILVFFIHYVIVRPLSRTVNGSRRVPWWHSKIGIMFAMLLFAIFVQQLVVVLSLTFGPDYPLRWLVRDIGFGSLIIAACYMYVVYVIESRDPDSVLSPHTVSEGE